MDSLKRGDLVTISVGGDYGKPRPALVIQADSFDGLPSVTVLQLTSDVRGDHPIRITVQPDAYNGLRKPSQIMVDRAITVPREKTGPVFGRLEGDLIKEVSAALSLFLGLNWLMA